jgi:hypothetical protein
MLTVIMLTVIMLVITIYLYLKLLQHFKYKNLPPKLAKSQAQRIYNVIRTGGGDVTFLCAVWWNEKDKKIYKNIQGYFQNNSEVIYKYIVDKAGGRMVAEQLYCMSKMKGEIIIKPSQVEKDDPFYIFSGRSIKDFTDKRRGATGEKPQISRESAEFVRVVFQGTLIIENIEAMLEFLSGCEAVRTGLNKHYNGYITNEIKSSIDMLEKAIKTEIDIYIALHYFLNNFKLSQALKYPPFFRLSRYRDNWRMMYATADIDTMRTLKLNVLDLPPDIKHCYLIMIKTFEFYKSIK